MLACKVSEFCSVNDDTNVLPPSWTLKLTESWGEPKSDWQVKIEEGKAPTPLVFLLLSIFDQIDHQSLIPSTDVIPLTLNLKMTTAQVVETSVTVNNSPIQDYVHPDDHTQPTFEIIDKFWCFDAFRKELLKVRMVNLLLKIGRWFLCSDLPSSVRNRRSFFLKRRSSVYCTNCLSFLLSTSSWSSMKSLNQWNSWY